MYIIIVLLYRLFKLKKIIEIQKIEHTMIYFFQKM